MGERFKNFATISTGDSFFLRFTGSDGVRPGPDNSGWVCEVNSVLTVVWQAEPPLSAILWVVRGVDGTSVTVQTADGRGLVAVGTTLVLNSGATAWQLNRFIGYSNNFVPGYGWEPNAFTTTFPGVTTWFAMDAVTRRLGLSAKAAACTWLYVENTDRDAAQLTLENQLAFNVRVWPSGNWLRWSSSYAFGSSRPAELTSDRSTAALLQVRSLLETDSGFQFTLGVVASPWLLGADSTRRLVFGQPGGDTSSVATMTISVPPQEFAVSKRQGWLATVTTVRYLIEESLLLVPSDGPSLTTSFEFVVNPLERLRLGFADVLAGKINVVKPTHLVEKVTTGPGALPDEVYIVGQRHLPGCVSFPTYDLSWYPDVLPEDDVPVALGDCRVRWISGSPDLEPEGNVYWLSSVRPPGRELQTLPTVLRSYPMEDQTQCLVDVATGLVPPNCGAVRFSLFPSNLGQTNTHTVQNLAGLQCTQWADAPLHEPNNDGYVYIFDYSANNVTNPCQVPDAHIGASNFLEYLNRRLSAIVVPENLFRGVAI